VPRAPGLGARAVIAVAVAAPTLAFAVLWRSRVRRRGASR